MHVVLLAFAALLASAGLYFIFDFISRRLTGRVLQARIAGFQNKKDKGRILPIVEFEWGGKIRTLNIASIGQAGYLFAPKPAGSRVAILYRERTDEASLYGYAGLLSGLALFLPLLLLLAARMGKTEAYSQTLFVMLFAFVILGGWSFIRLMQKYY